MKRTLILFWLSLTLVSLNAITLDESIELALKNNLQLKSSAEKAIIAKEYYREVKSALLPQLSLTGGYQIKGTELPSTLIPPPVNYKKDLTDSATEDDKYLARIAEKIVNRQIPSKTSEESNFIGRLQLEQVLYLGGKLTAGIKAAGIYKDLESKNLELARQNTIFETTDSFYKGLLTKEAMEINRQAYELAEQHLNRVKTMFEQGIVSEFDLIRAELEIAKLKPQVQQAENAYALWEESFRQQLNLSNELSISLEGNIVYQETEEITLEEATKTAKKNRIELSLSRAGVNMREINWKALRASYLPNVALTAEYNGISKRSEISFEPNDIITSYQVMIGVQLPLFKGFGNRAKASQAKHEYIKASYEASDLEGKIELDIRNNWQKQLYAQQNYQAQKQRINLAEKGVKIATARYESQVGINLEVLDAQLEYKMARLSYLQAAYEAIIADVSMKKAMGIPLDK